MNKLLVALVDLVLVVIARVRAYIMTKKVYLPDTQFITDETRVRTIPVSSIGYRWIPAVSSSIVCTRVL